MTPTIDDAGRLCASPEDLRFLLTEAKRSGQSQVSAYGVTTSWRAHWNARLVMIDGLMKQLPDEPTVEESYEESGLDENGLIPGDKHAVRVVPPVVNDIDLDDLLG